MKKVIGGEERLKEISTENSNKSLDEMIKEILESLDEIFDDMDNILDQDSDDI